MVYLCWIFEINSLYNSIYWKGGVKDWINILAWYRRSFLSLESVRLIYSNLFLPISISVYRIYTMANCVAYKKPNTIFYLPWRHHFDVYESQSVVLHECEQQAFYILEVYLCIFSWNVRKWRVRRKTATMIFWMTLINALKC